MKSRCSFILKTGLAIVLCFILLVGTMTVGLAAIRDELTSTGWTNSTSGVVFHSAVIYPTNRDGVLSADTVSGLNTSDESGRVDFDILIAGTYKYKVVCNGDWFGNKNKNGYLQFNDSNSSGYWYVSHQQDGDSGEWSEAYFPAGKYVFNIQEKTDGMTLKYTLYRKKAYVDFGWDSGSWNNTYEMTYDSTGNNLFKVNITGNGQQLRFRPRIVDGTSDSTGSANYFPQGSNEDFIGDNYDETSGYNSSNTNNDKYWYIDTENGGTYTICLKNGKVWCEASHSPNNYFLTGTINNASTDIQDENKFSATATSGVYKLTKYFSSASSTGDQYLTITDSSYSVYHTDGTNVTSGAAADSEETNHSPNNDPKWVCEAPAGTIVTFTWDMRNVTGHTAPTLSWVIEKAKYVFEYTGRSGTRTYTVVSNTDPTAGEYTAQNLNTSTSVTTYSNRLGEINHYITQIGSSRIAEIFNKTVSFDSATITNPSPYTIKIKASEPTATEYTLKVFGYYEGEKQLLGSIIDDYNKTIDITSEALTNGDTPTKSAGQSIATMRPSDAAPTDVFLGWKKYDEKKDEVVGDFISTHANFGFSLTDTLSIIAVFGPPSSADPTWNAYVDKNEINVEMADDENGDIFNDSIIRFTYSGDSALQATSANGITETGVIILAQTGDAYNDAEHEGYKTDFAACKDKLVAYLNALQTANVNTSRMNSGKYGESYAFKIPTESGKLSLLNRVDICQVLDYATFIDGQYIVAAYYKDSGGNYHVSTAVNKTYTPAE